METFETNIEYHDMIHDFMNNESDDRLYNNNNSIMSKLYEYLFYIIQYMNVSVNNILFDFFRHLLVRVRRYTLINL